jgi:predicted Na+-dependent transporter
MVKTNKIEKTILISTILVLSLMASFVISELINVSFGGEFNISIVWYNFRHLHYAVLAPFVIPFFMIKDIDQNSNHSYIVITVVLTVLIPVILYFIFRVVNNIKKGEFKSVLKKWINYLILFIIFELWFLIGLVTAGMERL